MSLFSRLASAARNSTKKSLRNLLNLLYKSHSDESVRRQRNYSPKVNKVDSHPPKVRKKTLKADEPKGLLAKEIQHNLAKFPHCLLLTRVGNFYESYFDQASEIAALLKIKATSRRWNGGRVPMCGFPVMHLSRYLKMLVKDHQRFVAVCEEFPKMSNFGGKEFERRVVRVISPGTLIDEPFLNPTENNFLLAISPNSIQPDTVGLAWIDVSTGEFFSRVTHLGNLSDQLARIGPHEVVLDNALQSAKSHAVRDAVGEEGLFVSFHDPTSQASTQGDAEPLLPSFTSNPLPRDEINPNLEAEELLPLSMDMFTPQETSAITLLVSYMRTNLMANMPAMSLPNREGQNTRMQIDSHTIKALEIRERINEGGVKGSLLSVVKRTVTAGGTRLLSRWLSAPSTKVEEINARQSVVALLYKRPHFRADLLALLADAEDASRIVQRFMMGRGDPGDLFAIHNTIRIWNRILIRIQQERSFDGPGQDNWNSLELLLSRFNNLNDLSEYIAKAIDTTQPIQDESDQSLELEPESNTDLHRDQDILAVPLRLDGRAGSVRKFSIRPQFSEELAALHEDLKASLNAQEALERAWQLDFTAPSLTLRASPSQGFHVHIGRKKDAKLIADSHDFVLLSESGTTRTYFSQEWSQLAMRITDTSTKLLAAEREAFDGLRRLVNTYATDLRRNARILEEIDVTLGFAELACEMNWVRPTVVDEIQYHVENGRHPTVELGLLTSGRMFTPNSTHLEEGVGLQQLITGPNMGGKSTFLRQTALTAILAQAGSFVPADTALVGICDAIFSRVGAKDDLYHDRSTFMVEMLETATILTRATPRSLVIMDEVGRGTTTKDGLALAFATIHHLTTINKCRTLFATHFHELAYLLGYQHPTEQSLYTHIGFQMFDVDETADQHFAYSYRLRPGVNFNSHGLKVAQIAGRQTLRCYILWVQAYTSPNF
ncbi:muts domain V-domain-containing protein [Flagelloscypha sp. PMI_526]|nr:muts domain V-domain-containing protein [Flagelloscypha sp. PMI_526]